MRNPPAYAASLIAAVLLAGCGLSPEEKRDRAFAALADHRFTDARLDLGALLQDAPGDHALLEALARTQLRLGDGEGALAMLARLTATGKIPADLALMQAEAELLRGQYDAALAGVEPLDSAEAYHIAALAHVAKQDTEAAEAAFTAGRAAAGDKARLLSDFAIFRTHQGRLDEAEQLAKSARDADAQGLDPLIASARVAQARREPETALAYFTAAQKHWPEARAALLGRIGVLGDLGRLAEARPLIEQAAVRMPGDAAVTYLNARLVAEDGDWKRVRTILQPLEDSDDIGHRALYARALVEQGLHEQAIGRLTPLMRQVPGSADIRRLMARAQLGAGDPRAAMRLLEPMAKSASGTPLDLALYAEAARAAGDDAAARGIFAEVPPSQRIARQLAEADAAMREGKWRTAIDAYERLRQWSGDGNALVLNNLAYARGRTGETRAAIELAEKAHRLAPDNASIKDTLGWMLWQSDTDRSRGLALLREAAQLAPDNRAIADHLARANRS